MLTRLVQRVRHGRPVGLLRYHLYKALLAFPKRYACNLCGWSGRRFLTYLHRDVLCPSCGSQIRHRLLYAALESRELSTVEGRRVLHLSPEYCLVSVLSQMAAQYVRGDYATRDADLQCDAMRLPLRSEVVDVVIACDLLEHLPDDIAAMAEMHRVLRPGGVAMLSVPQEDGRAATFEDPSIATDEGRLAAYGQPDHLRQYGDDFTTRLETVGFEVAEFAPTDLEDAVVTWHVLVPPVMLDRDPRWNFRRIHFARKTASPDTSSTPAPALS